VAVLAQLLESPTLAPLLGYLVRPAEPFAAEQVGLIEELSALDTMPAATIVLLTRAASATAASYRFDMALRVARTRGIAALVLSGADAELVTPTAAAIAARSGTAILGAGPNLDLGHLAILIAREIQGGADAALLRAHTAMRAVDAHPAGAGADGLVQHASAAIGVPIAMVVVRPENGPSAPVVLDDHVAAWLSAPAQTGDLAMALDLVLHVAAGGAHRALAEERRARELPIQSRAEVLTELLAAPVEARDQLVFRARALGVPIDGWHVAARLEYEDLAPGPDGAALEAYEAREQFERAVLADATAAGGSWHVARAGLAPVMVRSFSSDPGAAATAAIAKLMDDALSRSGGGLPTTLVRCGVGSAHQGPGGLVTSVGEARAAATMARTGGGRAGAVAFDSVGLRRTLVEWYASGTAQEAVTTVLAPLTALGPPRAERLIRTLHVYLDQQGSLTRTAEALNLHRNAVAYRINQIFSLLEEVDQASADDRLLLQLACRARELAR
jgi:sugar diacid utilization regulator